MGFINELFGAKNEQWAKPISIVNSDQENVNGEQVNSRQTQLADALTAAMNGQGPSIAQDQLKRATGQAVNQGASAIASQRGINPALQAKMILDNQQKALGDAAGASSLLRNQEMQQATGQLAGALGTQRGQDIQQQQTKNQAIASQNNAITQAQLGTEGINANVGAGNAGQNAKTASGLLGGVGALVGMAEGGEVPEQPKIDMPAINVPSISVPDTSGASKIDSGGGGGGAAGMASMIGPILAMMAGGGEVPSISVPDTSGAANYAQWTDLVSKKGGAGGASGGNKMKPLIDLPAMVQSGVQNLFSPRPELESGAGMATASMIPVAKDGGKVPGKAKVAGDSPKNDTQLTLLSPGEEVIPRSAAGDPKLEKEFLEHLHKSKEKKIGGGKAGYHKVVQAQQNLHDRLSNLEKMCYGGSAA